MIFVRQYQLKKNLKMNAFQALMLTIAVQYCYSHKIAAETQAKIAPRNNPFPARESYTSIFLDGELYSEAPLITFPKNKAKALRKNSHGSLKGSKLEQWRDAAMVKPGHRLPSAKNTESDLEGIRPGKHASIIKPSQKQKINKFKDRLHRRHFTAQKNYHRKTRQRDSMGNAYGFANSPNYNFGGGITRNFSSTPSKFDQKLSNGSSFMAYKNPYQVKWPNATNYTSPEASVYRRTQLSDGLKSTNFNANRFPGYPDNQNYDGSLMHDSNVMKSYRNYIQSSAKFVRPSEASRLTSWTTTTTTAFPPSFVTFQRVAIKQRNLPANRQPPNGEKIKQEDDTKTEETESDDTAITFGVSCDQISNQTCWMQREVGDVLTLSVRIQSPKKSNLFQVRWVKEYEVFGGNKRKTLEIDPGKLPWNMVSGSEGRELRLNPVTNTDLDPNCIVAKVFLLAKHRGRTLYTHLKKLIFRIDSPIIDMGKLYAGEELTINIENFISLPEHGDLLLEWRLETKPHQYQSLPSNVKVSSSGRSLVLKELKKGRMGVLNCVIYSSNRFAVAKRRFNILNIAENVKRRSTAMDLKDRTVTSDLKGSRQCRHIIRRSQKMAIQRLEEGKKPKSRKKRFKRMESDNDGQADFDCEFLKRKVYSRFVRSLFGESSTEDPRILSLEQLLELSEEGDGTLDDQIPHEVHYVAPRVMLLRGTSPDELNQFPSAENCTSNEDCGKHATCILFKARTNSTNSKEGLGYCNCKPEFYGDGYICRKIPVSSHREKRLRRNAGKDFAVPKHLFYDHSKQVLPATTTELAEEDEGPEGPLKVLAFEEEESFLLSNCIDNKDCSAHGSCIQPSNGHPYCKCRPGFRGNGIFCWETMDYVPPEEHLVDGDDVNDAADTPELSLDHLGARGSESDELEIEEEHPKIS